MRRRSVAARRFCAAALNGHPHRERVSVAETEVQQEVADDHVRFVLDLENVRPDVVPLVAETDLEDTAAAGDVHVGVKRKVGGAKRIRPVADLEVIQLGRAPAAAAVDANPPQGRVRIVAGVGRPTEDVPLAAAAQADKRLVQVAASPAPWPEYRGP